MKSSLKLLTFVVLSVCVCVLGKQCNNIQVPGQSHTFRYEIETSTDETWRRAMIDKYEHYQDDDHMHLTPTDDYAWSHLLPNARKVLKNHDRVNDAEIEFEWEVTYRHMKKLGDYTPPQGLLKEVSLHNVRLHEDSDHARAMNINLQYLLMFDVDRLIWSFRNTSGLPSIGIPYGGWEAPNIELRGHFVGHYLSATAQMWASTHNEQIREKMLALVSKLSECQKKINTGYLSAFPTEFFDRLEANKFVWAPYYTIHKVMAGLLDQYTYGENPEALQMVTWMADYFYDRVTNFIQKNTLPKFLELLNEEFGGMNDLLYTIYNLTGNSKYQTLAHLFDKPCFLGLLATKSGDISDLHANTHIPIVIGAQKRYEYLGDPLYSDISTYFLDLVNTSHAYATGGTSFEEYWKLPNRMGSVLATDNEESCTSYNMLKISRNLYRWTKDISYADYYERTFTNGVLSIQRGTDPGIMIYFLPQGRGVTKAKSTHGWGTQFDSFWCCYGTGIESFSKLGDFIYFEEQTQNPNLYIAQYISSNFNWTAGNILIDQTVTPYSSWDPFLRVTFTFAPNNKGDVPSSTLNFRIPTWTRLDHSQPALLNNEPLSQSVEGGSYLSLTRKWNPGDNLTFSLSIPLRSEPLKDDRNEYSAVRAILYGPYLLVSHTIDDSWDLKVGPQKEPQDYIKAVPYDNNKSLFTFTQGSGNSSFAMVNLKLGDKQFFTMEHVPYDGTQNATLATYKIIMLDQSPFTNIRDAINKLVSIEPVHLPGMRVMHQGPNNTFFVGNEFNATSNSTSVFRVVQGLDGKKDTISIESESNKGCYFYSGVNYVVGQEVKLVCKYNSSLEDPTFDQAASFTLAKGLKQYHPISFIAQGFNRNYLMEPILAFRDETYTSYLNIYP